MRGVGLPLHLLAGARPSNPAPQPAAGAPGQVWWSRNVLLGAVWVNCLLFGTCPLSLGVPCRFWVFPLFVSSVARLPLCGGSCPIDWYLSPPQRPPGPGWESSRNAGTPRTRVQSSARRRGGPLEVWMCVIPRTDAQSQVLAGDGEGDLVLAPATGGTARERFPAPTRSHEAETPPPPGPTGGAPPRPRVQPGPSPPPLRNFPFRQPGAAGPRGQARLVGDEGRSGSRHQMGPG